MKPETLFDIPYEPSIQILCIRLTLQLFWTISWWYNW